MMGKYNEQQLGKAAHKPQYIATDWPKHVFVFTARSCLGYAVMNMLEELSRMPYRVSVDCSQLIRNIHQHELDYPEVPALLCEPMNLTIKMSMMCACQLRRVLSASNHCICSHRKLSLYQTVFVLRSTFRIKLQ